MTTNDQPTSRLAIWALAARPKTLPAGFAPIIMGTAMAYSEGLHHWPGAVCCLLGALLIQIATNFANDYYDHVKGADTSDRIGPTRATEAGWVTPAMMKRAMMITFGLACLPGLYIVWRGGWPFIAIGLLSILFGILYTGGPVPLGYLGLGDILVLIFFGPVAVGGTYYVQTLTINEPVILAGIAAGLFSTAILTVNNLRDIDQDREAGKKTLAVRFGRFFARVEYMLCIVIGCGAIPMRLYRTVDGHGWVLLAAISIVVATPIVKTVFTRTDGPALNNALAATGKLFLSYAILFAIGWNL